MEQGQEMLAQTLERFYAASVNAGSQYSNMCKSGATDETLSLLLKQQLHTDKANTRVTELLATSTV